MDERGSLLPIDTVLPMPMWILKFKNKRLAWLRLEAGETEEAKGVRDKRLQFRVRRGLLRLS